MRIKFVETKDYDTREISIPGMPFTCCLFQKEKVHGGVPYAIGWQRQYDGLNEFLVELASKAAQEADKKQRPKRVFRKADYPELPTPAEEWEE